ncbi:hypothetical protein K443DRAFT_442556 [Laccaria amethystina LaAM-08-1]|uniref:Unplaced genomic scaffold K443scaffold_39, whole genome shotgun sequence n=1 Tax=Laccaria amethystina LaAM-08-1 TaxID=1095629 RepID=A0A0C9WWI7_9AGAR|nr:hypothetical protein K443DRAFT_442556 [Laccaria amethystina LaAM-08-1]
MIMAVPASISLAVIRQYIGMRQCECWRRHVYFSWLLIRLVSSLKIPYESTQSEQVFTAVYRNLHSQGLHQPTMSK